MTLNARFILKCALWTARLTYFVAGFGFDHRQLGIGVARGAKAEWLDGLAPSSGQLTRCFSAIAEPLVNYSN